MDIHTLLDQLTALRQTVAMQRAETVLTYAVLTLAAHIFIDRILRRLADLTRMELDNKVVAVVHAPACWTVFGLGLLHAFVIAPLPPPWHTVLPNTVKTTIVLFWATALFKILHLLARKRTLEALFRKTISNDAFKIILRLLRLALFMLAAMAVLTLWDINLTPLFASAGIAGIAVAMAAKDSLANFFGGVSIYLDNTFKEGDYIVLDSGERGEVVDVGMRSSRILTRDDVMITIPNSILANTKIINESAPIPRFRIRIPVGVAYGSDPLQVERLLTDIAIANEQVAAEPVPRTRFRQFGASSLDFELLCWVDDPSLKGLVTHTLLNEIYAALNREGITIPFPQMDVHLDVGNNDCTVTT